MQTISSAEFHPLTNHAGLRMQQRHISSRLVDAVIRYGRTIHARGATYKVIGHKEVERFASRGIDLREADGIQVIIGHDGAVITAYRNHDLRKIRPSKRRHSYYH